MRFSNLQEMFSIDEQIAGRPTKSKIKDIKKGLKYKQSMKASNKIPSFEDIWKHVASYGDSYINELEHHAKDDSHRDDYESETGLDAEEDRDSYYEWVENTVMKPEAELKYHEILREYERIDGDDCWRSMMLPPKVDPAKHTSLGIYWTIDQINAEAHWGKYGSGFREVTYKGKINLKNVDWAGTIYARMDFSTGDSETEIRFMPHSPIYIYDAVIDGEKFEINDMRRC